MHQRNGMAAIIQWHQKIIKAKKSIRSSWKIINNQSAWKQRSEIDIASACGIGGENRQHQASMEAACQPARMAASKQQKAWHVSASIPSAAWNAKMANHSVAHHNVMYANSTKWKMATSGENGERKYHRVTANKHREEKARQQQCYSYVNSVIVSRSGGINACGIVKIINHENRHRGK